MQFGITFDYLCPFARNACETVLGGVDKGRDWQPRFVAFSLTQVHTADDESDVWDEPEGKSGVLALQWGLSTRDHFPDAFPAVHRALFAARHDHGKDIRDEAVVSEAVATAGADTDAVSQRNVFGVPSFLVDDHATFIRFMSRGDVEDLQRALDLMCWTNLNEFKRTRIPR